MFSSATSGEELGYQKVLLATEGTASGRRRVRAERDTKQELG